MQQIAHDGLKSPCTRPAKIRSSSMSFKLAYRSFGECRAWLRNRTQDRLIRLNATGRSGMFLSRADDCSIACPRIGSGKESLDRVANRVIKLAIIGSSYKLSDPHTDESIQLRTNASSQASPDRIAKCLTQLHVVGSSCEWSHSCRDCSMQLRVIASA